MSTPTPASMEEARERMRAKLGGVRRHAGVPRKFAYSAAAEPAVRGVDNVDKVRTAVARFGGQTIAPSGEVVFHRADGQVLHFAHPKVTIATASNCTFVSGNHALKNGDEFNTDKQMLEIIRNLTMKRAHEQPPAADDDEVPELIPEDFEAEADAKDGVESKKETDVDQVD
ncbi:NAC domain protein [Gregarina niphandrodes]|uniref:Nascent polypeptide-associated complex subunit beta n=1 Tax=Gregarina niphandrodes TaxID=110365 RepID=A0A023B1F1_GRENI|nr:NAC domain protein [Gregarina niphandrodes]EZG47359.1 NAC domain protein [Gregarina niphandrodes]|eukprot:XP_011132182.1 NAC domain protein [Gregarina niphandrodes]